MLSIIMITSWRWTPFAMLVLLAGLQALPDDQLEAARVDGAGWWWQFRGIVLPHLRPFLELTALLLSMNLIQTFGEIALLTAGGPAYGMGRLLIQLHMRCGRGGPRTESGPLGSTPVRGVSAVVVAVSSPMVRGLR